MGCFASIAKYLVFLFNFLIVVCAIILIVFGALSLNSEGKLNKTVLNDYSIGGFAIAVGVIIFFIAFFGCCGAIKQNKCLLNTYAVILIILLILQIALAALAFVTINDNDKFLEKVEDVLKPLFDDAKNNNKDAIETVNEIQDYFDCCGLNNGLFWGASNPTTCKSENYFTGCIEGVKDGIASKIKVIGGIAIGFAVLELVGAVLACMIKTH